MIKTMDGWIVAGCHHGPKSPLPVSLWGIPIAILNTLHSIFGWSKGLFVCFLDDNQVRDSKSLATLSFNSPFAFPLKGIHYPILKGCSVNVLLAQRNFVRWALRWTSQRVNIYFDFLWTRFAHKSLQSDAISCQDQEKRQSELLISIHQRRNSTVRVISLVIRSPCAFICPDMCLYFAFDFSHVIGLLP